MAEVVEQPLPVVVAAEVPVALQVAAGPVALRVAEPEQVVEQ